MNDAIKTPHPANASSDAFLTAAQLRARWQVSGMFLWRLRRDGKLNAYKIGTRGVRFAVSEVSQIEAQARA